MLKDLDRIRPEDRGKTGGKCAALAVLRQSGFKVPAGACLCFETYLEFVRQTGLRDRIHFELNRKRFEDMRWEELWDAALRIRSMFLKTPLPDRIEAELAPALDKSFGERPVAVRSSALAEDSAGMSFAGLHDSYVNVRGARAILESVKLVWASLWSDRALLYRREIGLDVESSAMGVVVQEMISGEASGVAFSRDPESRERAIVEAVHGLNQGMVDGTVEPDHWVLERDSGKVISHRAAERVQAIKPRAGGSELISLGAADSSRPPLDHGGLVSVLKMAMRAEDVFGSPQDVEWTYAEHKLYTLQSRPITTLRQEGEDDERAWYLSLTRSYDNLKKLREKIENEIVPGMDVEAARMEAAGADIDRFAETELADEIERRVAAFKRWTKAYWDYCIPFAHGMRLFGQVYNDTLKPVDPYEFVDVLSGESTLGKARNSVLLELAGMVVSNPRLDRLLTEGEGLESYPDFMKLLDSFMRKYGSISGAGAEEPPPAAREKIIGLVLEMARRGGRGPVCGTDASCVKKDREKLAAGFLSRFKGQRAEFAQDLLDLARASYRWRDDYNIYLARIEAETARAVDAGRRRIGSRRAMDAAMLEPEEVSMALRDKDYQPERGWGKGQAKVTVEELKSVFRPRQLTGLPAGPGIGTGPARVGVTADDLYSFKSGEVLVCDAIEPEMTLVVPLAAGIVERRGGMLIHGAIIA
ncbi:MAG: PEP/pyruvate-binding domain-containing protein, partial [bacterium]